MTVTLITCCYKEKEFIRVGYYVNNEHSDPAINAEIQVRLFLSLSHALSLVSPSLVLCCLRGEGKRSRSACPVFFSSAAPAVGALGGSVHGRGDIRRDVSRGIDRDSWWERAAACSAQRTIKKILLYESQDHRRRGSRSFYFVLVCNFFVVLV